MEKKQLLAFRVHSKIGYIQKTDQNPRKECGEQITLIMERKE